MIYPCRPLLFPFWSSFRGVVIEQVLSASLSGKPSDECLEEVTGVRARDDEIATLKKETRHSPKGSQKEGENRSNRSNRSNFTCLCRWMTFHVILEWFVVSSRFYREEPSLKSVCSKTLRPSFCVARFNSSWSQTMLVAVWPFFDMYNPDMWCSKHSMEFIHWHIYICIIYLYILIHTQRYVCVVCLAI